MTKQIRYNKKLPLFSFEPEGDIKKRHKALGWLLMQVKNMKFFPIEKNKGFLEDIENEQCLFCGNALPKHTDKRNRKYCPEDSLGNEPCRLLWDSEMKRINSRLKHASGNGPERVANEFLKYCQERLTWHEQNSNNYVGKFYGLHSTISSKKE